MLELSGADDVFEFKHDGKVYSLPAITIDDVEQVSEWLNKPHKEMTQTVKDHLLSLADDETAAVIRRVGLKSFFRIFRAWAGMDLGESQPSDES